MALEQEAFSVFGKRGWSESGGFLAKAERIGQNMFLIVISGPGPKRVQRATHYLLACHSSPIINIGVAGALAEDLEAGDVLCPSVIKSEEGALDIDSSQRLQLEKVLRPSGVPLTKGNLFTALRVIASPEEKKRLHEIHSCQAVDMEAYHCGAECLRENVPFFAIKAISDRANESLPGAITSCVDDIGRVRLSRLILSILSRPWQIPRLLELQKSFKKATYSLELAMSAIGAHPFGVFSD